MIPWGSTLSSTVKATDPTARRSSGEVSPSSSIQRVTRGNPTPQTIIWLCLEVADPDGIVLELHTRVQPSAREA